MTPLYTISILCHNRAAMTDRCLRSVLLHSPPQTEILVTDNGSSDGTYTLLQGFAGSDSRIRVIRNFANLGIPEPKQRACDEARGEFFVSLDNDAWVGPGWLEALRRPFIDGRVAQVGRKGQHQSLFNNGIGKPDGPLEYIDGSCFMIRTQVGREKRIADPYLPFAYADDSDFSLRLRAYDLMLATVDAPIWHLPEEQKDDHGGVQIHQYLCVNAERFSRRWHDYLRRRAFDPTIAIRRTGAIGDVVIATALLRRLKELWPHCRIFFCTNAPQVLERNGHIEEVLAAREYNALASRMAYHFDLDGAYEADLGSPYVMGYAAATVFSDQEPRERWRPDIWISAEDEARAEELVGPGAIVAVCAGPTTWSGKDIDSSFWIPAIVRLRRAGYQVAEIGTGPAFLADQVDFPLVGRTSFSVLAAILKRARLYLGLDSAPFHVTAGTGTPAICFFGCTSPEIVSGTHPRPVALRAEGLDCLGCHHTSPVGTTSLAACRRGDLACRRLDRGPGIPGIRPDAALRAVESWLTEEGRA